MIKQKIVCIVGPSGVGKTALSVRLAKAFDGEIISADSMQIYKEMDIGTAKITKAEMDGVLHHMIDIVSPTEKYSVSDWKAGAEKHINDITCRNKVPFIVGGTGLYVSSLIYNYNFSSVAENSEVREYYQKILNEKGAEELHKILAEKCPQEASKIHPNKTKAVIRALEVFDCGSQQLENSKNGEQNYDYLLIGLNIDRAKLYEQINLRVDQMASEGLFDEFRNLVFNNGLKREHQSALAIGYREIFDCLDGIISEKECLELIKKDTRNYAKRQLTWFRRMENIEWFEPSQEKEITARIKEFLYEDNN